MTPEPALDPEQALRVARAVAATVGPSPDEESVTGALATELPGWSEPRRGEAAREALLLRQLVAVAGAADGLVNALGLCLARPSSEPVWMDFERLLELLASLEGELRGQSRRARLPGSPGRRATAEARGTREVMARAAAEFAAVWRVSGSTAPEHRLDS